MRSVVLDSGVLLALWDPHDTHHHAARTAVGRHLTDGRRLVVPVSILSDTLVGAFRATPYAVRTIERFVDQLVGHVLPVDREVGRVAARLRAHFRWLPLSDALVAAPDVTGAQRS